LDAILFEMSGHFKNNIFSNEGGRVLPFLNSFRMPMKENILNKIGNFCTVLRGWKIEIWVEF
jgi:hypothetical protein